MRHLLGFFLLFVASCGFVSDMDGPTEPMGDFALGFAVGLAPHPTKGPASREASNEDLGAALKAALIERFARFTANEDTRFYNIGASVDGYVLAQPGVPIVLSPKSVMVVRVTVFDDATGEKLNDEPLTVTSVEELSGESAIGSGLTMTAEEQLASITRVVASDLELMLREKHRKEGWFAPQEPADVPMVAEESGIEEGTEVEEEAEIEEGAASGDIDAPVNEDSAAPAQERLENVMPVPISVLEETQLPEAEMSETPAQPQAPQVKPQPPNDREIDLLPADSAQSGSVFDYVDQTGDEMPYDMDMPAVVPLPMLR